MCGYYHNHTLDTLQFFITFLLRLETRNIFFHIHFLDNSKKKQMERERELKNKQLPNVPASKKLRPNDIHRIVQHTDNSIFSEEKCCLWTGYITNLKNKRKGTI